MTTDPTITEATLAVQELIRQGLSLSEICRLCRLPGRTATIRTLHEGTCRALKPEVAQAILDGFQRHADGDRGYIARRGTRPAGEASTPLPESKPMPRMIDPRSRLARRLVEKRRAA